VILLEKDG